MAQQKEDIFAVRTLDRLYRFACSLLGTGNGAEDVVHNVMEKMWRRRESLEQTEQPEAYLVRAVRNACIDRLRSEKFRSGGETAAGTDSPQEEWEARELVSRAIAALPPRQRTVIHLKEIEGYSTREIADLLSVGENQVRTILSRARKTLKQIMVNDGYDGF